MSTPARGKRRWIVRLALVALLPLVVLGLTEGSLRVLGVGYPTDFLLPAEGRPDELMPNPRFGWRFFPRDLARRPEGFTIAPKAPGTVRVFVLGSSAAQGFPDPGVGLARVLEVLLRERHPGTRFEVVNAAMVAIDSHVVVDIARDCAERGEPDLLVVYEGNNEVIGPFGPGTVFARYTTSHAAIRAALWVRRLRTGQLLADLRAGDGGIREWTGMELFLEHRIAADDPRLAGTAEHFRTNLRDVCRAANARGTPVVLCTVGVNLRDCPPFVSLHRDGLSGDELAAWNAAWAAGTMAEDAGRHAEALERYGEAGALDDRHAELRFRRARCLLALGRDDEARTEFGAARDLDALRFRTDSTLNAVVREVAASERATLVDIERRMAEPDAAPHGIPGAELFLEHCHMTFAGNHLIACAVLDAIEPLLPAAVRDGAPAGAPASLERCAERLGLSPWHEAGIAASVAALMARPPFTEQLGHEAALATARARAAELRAAATPAALGPWASALRGVLEEGDGDPTLRRRLADVLAASGDLDAAEAAFRAVVDELAFDVDASHALARVLALRGEPDAALAEYRRTMDSSWSTRTLRAEAFLAVARIEEQRGASERAAEACAEALRERPTDANAMTLLGQLELRRKRAPEAERWLRAAVAAAPELTEARMDLARALAAQRRVAEAYEVLAELVRQRPDDAGARLALGDAAASLGHPEEALVSYQQAARLAPEAAETRAKLGGAYLAAGRLDEAVAELSEAVRLRPDLPGVQQALRSALDRRAAR